MVAIEHRQGSNNSTGTAADNGSTENGININVNNNSNSNGTSNGNNNNCNINHINNNVAIPTLSSATRAAIPKSETSDNPEGASTGSKDSPPPKAKLSNSPTDQSPSRPPHEGQKFPAKNKMSINQEKQHEDNAASKSAVSQRQVDIKIANKPKDKKDVATAQELSKKVLKLDLKGKELDEYTMKSPKSPIAARLPHQSSLTSSVDVDVDRKTLREALYQGIFSRHRRTIFAVGSFLRMLRSRNSYNTIRSSSEEPEEAR